MTKVKSNASWNGLPPKQRRTLESWLFDEKLGYQETLVRARKELGLERFKKYYSRFVLGKKERSFWVLASFRLS